MQNTSQKHRLKSWGSVDMLAGHSFKKTCLAVGVMQGLCAVPSLAATITVDDSFDGVSGCTLRSAIVSINNAQNSGGCNAVGGFGVYDTINLGVNSVSGLTASLDITSDVMISAPQNPASISSLGNGSVFDIRGSSVTLENVIVLGGSASLDGGGIFARDSTLELKNSTINGNSASDDGGGIFARDSVVTLDNSSVTANSASTNNSSGDDGGGIYARSSTVTLNNSIVSGNSANDEGGGVFTTSSLITINNSTISGNHAGDEGGGVLVNFNSNVSLTHSTVSNNTADRTGGGISAASGSVSLRNSLVAGNIAGSGPLAISELSVSAAGAYDLVGNNLLGDDSKTSQEAINVTPIENVILSTSDSSRATSLANILAPLANNGGMTLTHALVEGSPAINAASNAVCAASPIRKRDQRNFFRVDRCDIGAIEFGATPPVFRPAIIVPPIMLLLGHE